MTLTPEQKKLKTAELVAMLEEKRDAVYANLRQGDPENGDKLVAEKKEAMQQVADGLNAGFAEHFGVTVADDPLLAIAVANVVGSHVAHSLEHAQELGPVEMVTLVTENVFGLLEGLTHAAVEAIRAKNAG